MYDPIFLHHKSKNCSRVQFILILSARASVFKNNPIQRLLILSFACADYSRNHGSRGVTRKATMPCSSASARLLAIPSGAARFMREAVVVVSVVGRGVGCASHRGREHKEL